MARPIKKGLDYFPFDLNFFEDTKIMDLTYEYGVHGPYTYILALTFIYEGGYYLSIPVKRFAQFICRRNGDSDRDSIDRTEEILWKCAELGLFDKAMMEKEIFTSKAIQRRYAAVTARRKHEKRYYWLLKKNDELFSTDSAVEEATPTCEDSAAET